MRKITLAIAVLFLLSSLAAAQTTENRRGWGYGFFGVGGATSSDSTIYQAGGGGEGLIYKGISVGAEGGGFGSFNGGGGGMFSVNGGYHFQNSRSPQKLVPFMTAGYTFLAPSDQVNLFNFGGGVNYWAGERVGLRVEFRDHVFPDNNNHLFNVRVGVTFR